MTRQDCAGRKKTTTVSTIIPVWPRLSLQESTTSGWLNSPGDVKGIVGQAQAAMSVRRRKEAGSADGAHR
jgi:hypothetical protein